MKYFIAFFLCIASASAINMEQVLMEEPMATNRNASVWSGVPLVTGAATREYLKTLMVTSSYQNALEQISAILSETTERFSTDWSYIFTLGGGIRLSVLEVRSTLGVDKPVYSPGLLATRYLSVTNGGQYGTVTAGTALISGTTIGVGETAASSASVVTTGVFSTSYLTGGAVTIDAPAVLFTRPPILYRQGSVASNGWASSSSIKYVGGLSIGAYYDGVMRLNPTNSSVGLVYTLVGSGIGANIKLYENPTGDAYALSSVADIPVLVSHYPIAEPLFVTGFWKYSSDEVDAATIVLTSAVSRCFAVLTDNVSIAYINGGTNVANYTSVAALNTDSPALGPMFHVSDWRDALTNTVAGLALADGAGGVVATNSLGTIFTNSWDTVVVTNVALEVVTNTLAVSTITSSLGTSLTNSYGEVMAGMTNISVSVSNYVAATGLILDPTTGMIGETASRGVVAVADNRTDGRVNYSKYRQMLPEGDRYYRVSMQLNFRDPAVLPSATPARYWLKMNGRKLTGHRVSSAGETGPAFAFIDTTSTTPGYLYLDMSEFVAIHGINVLKGASYYVKLESLRGLDPWHNQ